MKQTILIKLVPNETQFAELKETMQQFNEACNTVADTAFQRRVFNNWQLQHLIYRQIREQFHLSSQMAVRAISKVADSYKRDKTTKPTFDLNGAMVYDQRILSWKGLEYVSILTLRGRQKIPISIGFYQEARIDKIRGQADLILRDGKFYLAATIEAPETEPFTPIDFLGVDLGVKNIATDSDGERWVGKELNGIRSRHAKLRSKLQTMGTKSAKRLLKKRSGKEYRFATAINHAISKRIVQKAKDTLRGIALENLKGIRLRVTVKGSRQRRVLHSWGFNQLQNFIEYKAKVAGVPVVYIEPKNTSRTCPNCGYIAKTNRDGEQFYCGKCGFVGHADHIAAVNIGRVAFQPAIRLEGFFRQVSLSPLGTIS
ncbi:transposase [Candidatus Bathyarchaeota archaeon]|nr:transposase [Candidatus Bathyarchaeota archaeon]